MISEAHARVGPGGRIAHWHFLLLVLAAKQGASLSSTSLGTVMQPLCAGVSAPADLA